MDIPVSVLRDRAWSRRPFLGIYLVKATEQNDKLNRAVIVSVVLHIVLIALLIWGSLHENAEMSAGGGGDGAVVAP
ncbi:cell envelope integrity inner membrane protein TolA [Serratia rubidaea]|uniref:Cell envelope integrity inner membrane protein TolA n=1 Tax=Serratia rubidaea TaxID=61652 RepID=A0A3S4JWY5_SERRU|nr:cell envelope integrity inner membrane protein TolA [Serratia rubidaea]